MESAGSMGVSPLVLAKARVNNRQRSAKSNFCLETSIYYKYTRASPSWMGACVQASEVSHDRERGERATDRASEERV